MFFPTPDRTTLPIIELLTRTSVAPAANPVVAPPPARVMIRSIPMLLANNDAPICRQQQ